VKRRTGNETRGVKWLATNREDKNMVRIPVYESNVNLRPIHQQGVESHAIKGAFGGGDGLKSLAAGVEVMGEAFKQRQDLEDATRAQDAENEFALYMQTAMYGDKGYMLSEGRNAYEGRGVFMETAEKRRREIAGGLKSEGARRRFNEASTARMLNVNQQALVHAAKGQKSWVQETSAARVNLFAQDALNAVGNEAQINRNIAAGLLELRQQAVLDGLDGDALKLKEKNYISGVYSAVVQQMAQADPIAAKDYMDRLGERIEPQDRFKLEKALETPLYQAQTRQGLEAVKLATLGARGLGSTAQDAIAKASAKHGVPAQALAVIAMIESKGNPNAKNPNSSAGGLFQQITSNAKQYGVKNKFDPYQSADGAARFMVDNQNHLRRVLGRDPTVGELYLAHQQGAGGAAKLLTNPNARAIDVVGAAAVKLNVPRPKGMSDQEFNAKISAMSAREFANLWTAKADRMLSGGMGVDEALAGIKDDRVREGVASLLEAESKAQAAVEKQEKERAFQWITSEMATYPQLDLNSLPLEIQRQIGIDGILKLQEYQKMLSGEGVVTDAAVYLELSDKYAADPSGFMDIDLLQYRDKLSDSDWKKIVGWRQDAIEARQKGGDGGGDGDKIGLSQAMSQAKLALEAAGISSSGFATMRPEEAKKKELQFRRAMIGALEEFYKENGRKPNEVELEDIISALMVPVVIKGTGWFDFGRDGHFFEGRERDIYEEFTPKGDGYERIPVDEKLRIYDVLRRENGIEPTQEEIAQRWFEYLMATTAGGDKQAAKAGVDKRAAAAAAKSKKAASKEAAAKASGGDNRALMEMLMPRPKWLP